MNTPAPIRQVARILGFLVYPDQNLIICPKCYKATADEPAEVLPYHNRWTCRKGQHGGDVASFVAYALQLSRKEAESWCAGFSAVWGPNEECSPSIKDVDSAPS